ncbi:MAG: sigma-70 family RNA polymerase sigma factor [Gillisia sp.]
MSLKQLIHNSKNQDIKAQEQLYRLYANKLFAVCLKYSNSYQQAEDNLQDGFMIIFDKIKQYQDKGSFEGWMKRIMINTTLQKYRKQTVFEIVNEEHYTEPDLEIDEEEVSVDYLLNIIQELPERYRQVFNLYAMDGFSHKEISEMLQITTGTSKSNLARARLILKEKIEATQVTQAVQSS